MYWSNIFFLSFHEQTIFFQQVAEQTIYFPKFAEQSFFSQKTIAPPPPGIKWSAPYRQVSPLSASELYLPTCLQKMMANTVIHQKDLFLFWFPFIPCLNRQYWPHKKCFNTHGKTWLCQIVFHCWFVVHNRPKFKIIVTCTTMLSDSNFFFNSWTGFTKFTKFISHKIISFLRN